jgi:hypothetical protein
MNTNKSNINLNHSIKAIATLIILIAILLSNTINIHAQEQQTSIKHSIKESIMYCTDSQQIKLSDISKEDKQSLNITSNVYLSTLQDENGDQYNIYSDDNLINQWFVCVVDTMNTKDIEDDDIIDTYLLDEYVFAE